MSNFTLISVLDSVRSNIEDVLARVLDKDIESVSAEEVCDLLDSNHYLAPEVISYADAWEIVAGGQFDNYYIEHPDFSDCKNALECVMLEAQQVVNCAYYEEREKIASEVLSEWQTDE